MHMDEDKLEFSFTRDLEQELSNLAADTAIVVAFTYSMSCEMCVISAPATEP
jgi:hypothetical protein